MGLIEQVKDGQQNGNFFVSAHSNKIQGIVVGISFFVETILLASAFLVPICLFYVAKQAFPFLLLFLFFLFWLITRVLNQKSIIEQRIWLQNNAVLTLSPRSL